ncbi:MULTISPECIES: hypothetical protein [Bacillus]|uniref:Helix-turn-helix type 11 domain-containing protein n=2 Tax=Bacillus cereus group TaxID=86661 RepID=A0A2C1DQ85_BACCE|nr:MULTISPECIES: hypothetical protein [Bacillus cereus group]OFD69941.1 hypothetical protein BWGOE8_58620 [Bacillus mycoides]OFD70302.1 hypothetical protein BWGOE9_56620 [Bacillus mycoides]OFD70578.1 hypothetical protein BWGOE10_57670 [Bacillus mycoides]PGT02586.1 hypothetical protein COD09_11635 [Bacillus cereus]
MLTFKQIERKIDSVVLDYIRSYSYVPGKVKKELFKLSKTKIGTKYVSRNYISKEFSQVLYERQVREYYLTYMQKEEKNEKKKKRKRPEKGRNITVKECFEIMLRDLFEHRKGERDTKGRQIQMNAFVMNFDKETRLLLDKKTVKTMEKLLEATKKFSYFTPNMFIDYRFFTKEVLSLLGVIILDFDLDKSNVVMSKDELRLFVKKKLGVELSMIWDTPTKGNYAGTILLKKMAGTPPSVHLYEQVVKEMTRKLDGLADASCFNANHVFVMPKNSPRTGKMVRLYNEDVHSINAFRWLLNERDERRKRENSVIDFKQESFKKEPAVAALLNGDVSYRDHAAFTLALVLRWLKYTQEECANYMYSQWLPKVQNEHDHPFTERELGKCIKHAYSGKYRNFKSTWIEICTGIPCNLSGYFEWQFYENKGIYIMDTEARLREFFKENGGTYEGNIKSIAEELDVSVRSLERHIATLRDNNELIYQTKRGRGAKTVYHYAEQQLDFTSVLRFEEHTIDEEIAYLNELDTQLEKLSTY